MYNVSHNLKKLQHWSSKAFFYFANIITLNTCFERAIVDL